jgi:hypothetical protein
MSALSVKQRAFRTFEEEGHDARTAREWADEFDTDPSYIYQLRSEFADDADLIGDDPTELDAPQTPTHRVVVASGGEVERGHRSAPPAPCGPQTQTCRDLPTGDVSTTVRPPHSGHQFTPTTPNPSLKSQDGADTDLDPS